MKWKDFQGYVDTLGDGTNNTVDSAFADTSGAKKCIKGGDNGGAPDTAHVTVLENTETLADCKKAAEGNGKAEARLTLAFQYHEANKECTLIAGFDAIVGSATDADGFVCHAVKDMTDRVGKAKAWGDALGTADTKFEDFSGA